MNAVEFFLAGGIVAWPLLAFSIAAIALSRWASIDRADQGIELGKIVKRVDTA